MTWRDCKKIILQRMFLPCDGNFEEDASIATYINAMPAAANEALLLLASEGIFNREVYVLTRDGSVTDQNEYDLSILCNRYHSLIEDEIYFTDSAGRRLTNDFVLENGTLFCPKGGLFGTWTLYYNAYPEPITSATDDNATLLLEPEVCMLLPLYVASQLYKDDDLAFSVQYRNEFEAAKESILAARKKKYGKNANAFVSVTGWV